MLASLLGFLHLLLLVAQKRRQPRPGSVDCVNWEKLLIVTFFTGLYSQQPGGLTHHKLSLTKLHFPVRDLPLRLVMLALLMHLIWWNQFSCKGPAPVSCYVSCAHFDETNFPVRGQSQCVKSCCKCKLCSLNLQVIWALFLPNMVLLIVCRHTCLTIAWLPWLHHIWEFSTLYTLTVCTVKTLQVVNTFVV